MQSGHPFDTEERDAQRAYQRKMLRAVPDHLFSDGRVGVLPVAGVDRDTEGAIAEAELRRLAQVELEPLAAYLERMASIEAAQIVGQLLMSSVNPKAGAVDAMQKPLAEVQARALEGFGKPEGQTEHAIARVVALLCWADELADDGYRDPRLPDPSG